MKPHIFLALPCYGDRINASHIKSLNIATKTATVEVRTYGLSILTRNFNSLYVMALNDDRFTHFAMLHDDTEPDELWIDKLLGISSEFNADIVSAISPIKDVRGLTSTAIDEPVGNNDPRWRVRRLSLHELHDKHPVTFTNEKLLLNTGCMLVRLKDPRTRELWFSFDDAIIDDPKRPGKKIAVGVSEDWVFSRRANALGLKLAATRAIKIKHTGRAEFTNAKWGAIAEDTYDSM